ncbi:MAG: FIST C-terminal domain-containing protein, partial [Planctomycetota bacterium]
MIGKAVCVGVGVSLVLALAAGAMGQDSRPAPKEMPDAWLSELALRKLAEAAKTGQYKPLQDEMAKVVLGRLAAAGTPNLDALNDVLYVTNACEFLPAAEPLPDGRSFAQWLVSHRNVGRLLFRTLAYDRPRARGVKELHAIWQAEPKLVAEYANLAVAFATASPESTPGDLVKPATPVQAFTWYIKHCRQPRFDLRTMPFELSRYLACTSLALAERNWAQTTYAKETNADHVYTALKYDMDYVKLGTSKKISNLPFTLPNLRQVGGVCLERAYYAAEVFRSMGVPSVMICGLGTRGGHAWLGYLRTSPDGKSVAWDTTTGRYAEDRYFVGELFDPVHRAVTNDCELCISVTALLFPLSITSDGDVPVVRTILSIDEEQKSMTFAGDMPEGKYARLMKANFERLIDGASRAAENSAVPMAQPVDLAILISCVGRKLVLGQRIEEEVEGVRKVFGADTMLTGFYSYGEISPFTPSA